MRSRYAIVAAAAFAALSAQAVQLVAQERPPAPPAPPVVAPLRTPAAVSVQGFFNTNRAVIGASLGTAGAGDSAGVLIERVTEGGPAAGAGIVAGDRIVAVNGQDIRLTRGEAADRTQHGLAVRRLTRAIGELEPGSELRLRVRGSGGERNVTLNVVSAADLARDTARTPGRSVLTASADRPVVGLSSQATGTPRDTIGVFVSSVVPDGPADRAGIQEGDRIVSVGDTDLRVRQVDASDRYVAQLKATALTTAIREATVGEPLEMRVWRAGQVRTVRVTPQRSSEVRGSRMLEAFSVPAFNFEALKSVPGIQLDSTGSGITIFRGSNLNDVELQSRLRELNTQLEAARQRMEASRRTIELRNREVQERARRQATERALWRII